MSGMYESHPIVSTALSISSLAGGAILGVVGMQRRARKKGYEKFDSLREEILNAYSYAGEESPYRKNVPHLKE